MIGLLKPEGGHIRIEGRDVPALEGVDLSEIRKKIGFLFQDAAFFDSISVGENVAFPLRRHTDKPHPEIQSIVREKLKEVELEGQENKMPAQLSGGM